MAGVDAEQLQEIMEQVLAEVRGIARAHTITVAAALLYSKDTTEADVVLLANRLYSKAEGH